VTAAAEGGAPDWLIMQRTGHKTAAVMHRYIRPASVFQADPLRKVL
jgi:hypothetical protein